jgi:DNA-binding transcriptional ArsR family regulator
MDQERIFKALSDQSRLRILNLFLVTKVPLCVCRVVEILEIPQYQASRQLQILKIAGLLSSEKRGTWVYYALSFEPSENASLFTYLSTVLLGGVYAADAKRASVVAANGNIEACKR